MKTKISLIFLFLSTCLSSLNAYAWWNEDWAFRKQIQVDVSGIDHSKGLNGEMSFPTLVRLHPGNFQYFGDMQLQAQDLRFIGSDDKTPLKFYIENYDPVAQVALVWVDLRIDGSAVANGSLKLQSFWMYYGNQTSPAASERKGVFSIDYAYVGHFEDLADSGPYQNNPQISGATIEKNGYIGSGLRLDGSHQFVLQATDYSKFDGENPVFLSFWAQIDGEQNGVLAELVTADRQIQLRQDGLNPVLIINGPQGQLEQRVDQAIIPKTWQQFGLQVSPGKVDLMVNGSVLASLNESMPVGPMSFALGTGTGPAPAQLVVDEVQFISRLTDETWVKRLIESQSVGSTVIAYGGDEQFGSESEQGYFAAILNNVSVDGWAVIISLGLMLAISLIVVFGKWVMLSKIGTHNRNFLEAFQKTDPSTLTDLGEGESDVEEYAMDYLFDEGGSYQHSNLYRLYYIGMQQLKARVGKTLSAQASDLSPQSVDAIKAALDAALVREQQKLNKSMVMLTIAISGGPFLGLLGTVLGVMITFAAIAISGDVNINAIAPGVSAALMTTVAGLAVAIPALFAYNFLSTRIRDITIDMRVFSDELIARIAEYHR